MQQNDIGGLRTSYEKGDLSEKDLATDPYTQFGLWFQAMVDGPEGMEANAMTLSTVAGDGTPNARIVLLKGFGPEGFDFYTNYDSDKGREIEAHAQVCLSFFWGRLERQVILQGPIGKVDPAESDAYFASRPRGSRLGAHASNQSRVISGREVLEERLRRLEEEYADKEIPRPDHWGGYRVRPRRFEFWQGRADRLHDRFRYRTDDRGAWVIERLAP